MNSKKINSPPELFQHIFEEYNKTMSNPKCFKGYRLFAIDGSDFNPPYQSKSAFVMREQTGRPRNDGEPTKPYSQVHANMLFDLENRTYQDCILQPKASANERSLFSDLQYVPEVLQLLSLPCYN